MSKEEAFGIVCRFAYTIHTSKAFQMVNDEIMQAEKVLKENGIDDRSLRNTLYEFLKKEETNG